MSPSSPYVLSALQAHFICCPVLPWARVQALSTQRLYVIFKKVRATRIAFMNYDGLGMEDLSAEDQVMAQHLLDYEHALKGLLAEREHLPRKPRKAQYIKASKRKSLARKKAERETARERARRQWWRWR